MTWDPASLAELRRAAENPSWGWQTTVRTADLVAALKALDTCMTALAFYANKSDDGTYAREVLDMMGDYVPRRR